eukprot:scaffold7694_cov63-Phaeocystis_antarctica.AAC.2
MPANQASQGRPSSTGGGGGAEDNVASGRARRFGYRISPCVLTQHPRLSSHRNSPCDPGRGAGPCGRLWESLGGSEAVVQLPLFSCAARAGPHEKRRPQPRPQARSIRVDLSDPPSARPPGGT